MTVENARDDFFLHRNMASNRCLARGLDIALPIAVPEEAYAAAEEAYGRQGTYPDLYRKLLGIIFAKPDGEWQGETHDGSPHTFTGEHSCYGVVDFNVFSHFVDHAAQKGYILLGYIKADHVELIQPVGSNRYALGIHYMTSDDPSRFARPLPEIWERLYQHDDGERKILVFPPASSLTTT